MVKINYLLQHLAYYHFCRNNTISSKANLLWYELFNILNERSEGEERPELISVSYSTLQSLTSMSRQSIWRAGNELKRLGLIELRRGSKEESRKYVIKKLYDDSQLQGGQGFQVFQDFNLKHIQKQDQEHIQKQDQEHILDTYIKHKTKTKTKKNKNILSDSPEEKSKKSESIKIVIDYLNSATDSSYRSTTKSNQQKINARLSEGFTIDDFKTVIDKKTAEWKGTEMSKYLRPETLFGTKFEGYLNAPVAKKTGGGESYGW